MVKKILLISILACASQIGMSQVFSYTNNISDGFFHKLFDVYSQKFKNRRDAKSQYVGGVLTLFNLSHPLIMKNNYYSDIKYDTANNTLSLTASIVDQNQAAYVHMVVNNVDRSEWQALKNSINTYQTARSDKLLFDMLFQHPVLEADVELNVTQPLDTKNLSSILPIFDSAPDSLALSSYPVQVYSRITYFKDSGELYAEVDVDYEDRANIDFILQSITHGDLILDADKKFYNTEKFIINPYLISLNFENISLIQDMIKLELGSENEFVTAIVRHKIALDIKAKADKVDDLVVKSYYESLAQFIETPISFRVTVQSRTKSSNELIQFWYRLMSVVEYQSIIQAMPKPKSNKDVGLIMGNKVRQHHYQAHVKQLLDIINKSIEIHYYVNGQDISDN
jgi:hypothetical protein